MTVVAVLGVAVTAALALTALLVWARDHYSDPTRVLDRIEHEAAREYRRTHRDWPYTRPRTDKNL